jgi:hypothetical protein
LARIRLYVTREHIDERGFAGTIATDQTDTLTLRYVEMNVGSGSDRAKVFLYAARDNG